MDPIMLNWQQRDAHWDARGLRDHLVWWWRTTDNAGRKARTSRCLHRGL